ncbi:unnamed protein product, partial [Meganyctiphanes norvegica]
MKRRGHISELSSSPLVYLDKRQYHAANPEWSPNVASTFFLSQRLNTAKSLYRKDLYAHFGCVNAIEFSREGDLLVSGGDDRRVLLWNVDAALAGSQRPRPMKGEHNSNIFCLGFDSCNSKVFSAGNDEQVIVHDLKTGDTVDNFLHREAVYGVSVNPLLDSVFASAGEDGQVLLYDIRVSPNTDPICLARYHDAFHAVQFHPLEPMFVVTANSREGVGLWDVRKPRVPVIRYGEKRCAQSSMCARFNRTGSQIIALRRRLPPVLYDTQTSKAACQFDADHYYNSCTMKSCCFAGDNDQFVLSGSDDFNLYMWKIPQENTVNFVSEAHMVLRGHRSIVNQVRFNQQNFIIASSGVEKIVKLWSGLSLPGSRGSLRTRFANGSMTRRVFTHEEYIGLVMESGQEVNHDYSHGSTEEDPRMMAFFDSLVQREVEGWTSNTDLSDDPDLLGDSDGLDDDDTETTTTQSSASVITSQSDDNDSHEEMNSSRDFSCSSRDNSKKELRAQEGALGGGAQEGESHQSQDEDDDDKPDTGGSEWILRLIAKKRSQLRAAKRARRKRKHRKRQRKRSKQFLRTFTTNRRQYLYQPEGHSSLHQGQSREETSLSLSIGSNLRNSSRRRYMAPYIVMLQDDQHDSEDQEDEEILDDVNEDEVVENGTQENDNDLENGKRTLSSDSDSSTDDEQGPSKRKRPNISESDSDEESEVGDKKNGFAICDIVDSNSSDTDEEKVKESSYIIGMSKSTNVPTSKYNCIESILEETIYNGNICMNGSTEDLNLLNNGLSDILPISSITTNANGSLLFSTENGSLTELSNSLNLESIPKTPNKSTQNGTPNGSVGSTDSTNTPDSGIMMMPSSTEKSSEEDNAVPSTSGISVNLNNRDLNNSDSEQTPTFSFKKRIPNCSFRKYRDRNDEDI